MTCLLGTGCSFVGFCLEVLAITGDGVLCVLKLGVVASFLKTELWQSGVSEFLPLWSHYKPILSFVGLCRQTGLCIVHILLCLHPLVFLKVREYSFYVIIEFG